MTRMVLTDFFHQRFSVGPEQRGKGFALKMDPFLNDPVKIPKHHPGRTEKQGG